MSAIAREKTSEISRLGAGKCPHFRISGSLFQSFLYVFRRGELVLVRINGVSVIPRCPQGDSRLYVAEPAVFCLNNR